MLKENPDFVLELVKKGGEFASEQIKQTTGIPDFSMKGIIGFDHDDLKNSHLI